MQTFRLPNRPWVPVVGMTVLLLLVLLPFAAQARIVPGYYIVELEDPPAAGVAAKEPGLRRLAALQDRRATIQAQQRVMRRAMEAQGAEPFESVDTVANALLVRMPDERIARLASLPGVRRVYPVYELRKSLERAIPRHRVPEAWTRLGGGDLAGAGVKIAIIDTGIDQTHPGFVDPSIPMPEGFPRANQASDLDFTSNKVIVARSYLSLFPGAEVLSARDKDGHGTAVAMAAAGAVLDSADGPISGVAPKAYLGSYNVFPAGSNTRLDVILKAFDDAVRDGMDVINLSLGSPFALRPWDDIFSRIVERATAMGVLVVVASGNEGPEPFTIGDVGVAASAITVGASWNDRVLAASVRLETGDLFDAQTSDGVKPLFPLTAPLFDVAQLDPSGLACDSLPPGSLDGRIAFILRGVCFFEVKLNNVQAAGAAGAVVYTDADRPEAIIMAVGSATLPGVMVSHADGLRVKSLLGNTSGLTATVDFRVARAVDPNRIADFSSRGPNTDFSVKPDLVATGVALNTADLGGGFDITQGTSFSAPLVSGAAALLKAARPGFSGHQYRSMLINASAPLVLSSGGTAPVQQMGGGALDMEASLATTVTAYPTSVSFGTTAGTSVRALNIFNLGSEAETLTLSTQPFGSGPPPVASETTLSISARSGRTLTLTVSPQGLAPGEYQGFVRIQGSRPEADIRVPYWYAIRSDVPVQIKIVDQDESGAPGALLRDAIALRVTDGAGIPLTADPPAVTVVSGGGSVVSVTSADEVYPGLWEVTLRLGGAAGNNVFRVEAGSLSKEVTIDGR